MINKIVYLSLAFFLSVAGLQTNSTKAVNTFTKPIVTQPVNQKFLVDGTERTAIIFPNSAPAPKEGSPIVFVFHGHGGTAQNAMRRFRIHADWPEAVVFYMQGLPTATGRDPQGEKPGWQNSPGLHADRDLKFFDSAVEWAKQKYKIDDKRIYVCGHSNGGGMTYALWSARSSVIAAFAPSAAVFGFKARNAAPKPALLIIGEGDDIVPTANQERNAEVVLRLNECRQTGKETGRGIKLYDCKAGADTAVYTHSGGHRMPDDAGEMMVKFFKQHKLR